MHPLEHLFYYSCVLLHLLIPSHPLHVLFNLQHAALTPAGSHTGNRAFHLYVVPSQCLLAGYDGPVLNGLLPQGSYHHFLHHRYYECNYGTEMLPFDVWFGTFRDGKKVGASLRSTEL